MIELAQQGHRSCRQRTNQRMLDLPATAQLFDDEHRVEDQLNLAQGLSPKLVQREHDWALEVLGATSLVERQHVDEAEFQQAMAGVTSLLPEEVVDVVADMPKYRDEPARQCSATIALYERIVDLPPAQRHLLLRGMFQAGAF